MHIAFAPKPGANTCAGRGCTSSIVVASVSGVCGVTGTSAFGFRSSSTGPRQNWSIAAIEFRLDANCAILSVLPFVTFAVAERDLEYLNCSMTGDSPRLTSPPSSPFALTSARHISGESNEQIDPKPQPENNSNNRLRGTERLEEVRPGLLQGKSQRAIARELRFDEAVVRRDVRKLRLSEESPAAIEPGAEPEPYLRAFRLQTVAEEKTKRIAEEPASAAHRDALSAVILAWLLTKGRIARWQFHPRWKMRVEPHGDGVSPSLPVPIQADRNYDEPQVGPARSAARILSGVTGSA